MGTPASARSRQIDLVRVPAQHGRRVLYPAEPIGPTQECFSIRRVIPRRADNDQPGDAPVDRRIVPGSPLPVDAQRADRLGEQQPVLVACRQLGAGREREDRHSAIVRSPMAARPLPGHCDRGKPARRSESVQERVDGDGDEDKCQVAVGQMEQAHRPAARRPGRPRTDGAQRRAEPRQLPPQARRRPSWWRPATAGATSRPSAPSSTRCREPLALAPRPPAASAHRRARSPHGTALPGPRSAGASRRTRRRTG